MDTETIQLIKRTVAKDATDDELKMFINQANKLNLDPLAKEIYFIKYPNKKDPKNPTVSIQVGIDGLLKIAQNSKDFEGIIAFAVCKNDTFEINAQKYEVIHKFNLKDRGGMVGAWAQVNRKGLKPFIKYINLSEFYKDNSFWNNYPTDMAEKTAKKKALKDAYGISGVNTEDEEQTSKIAVPMKLELNPSTSTSDTPPISIGGMDFISPNDFKEVVNTLLPEKTKKSKGIQNKDEIYKFEDHGGHRYYYETVDICRTCEQEKLISTGSMACWDCDQKEIKQLKEEKPIVKTPIFSFQKKKTTKKKALAEVQSTKIQMKIHNEKIDKEVQKDLKEISSKFSLEYKDSLDPETLKFKGDDWYNSSTAKSKVKKDFPLFTFRIVIKQNFPKHADAIEELFKEQLADKTRSESLLFIYYNALKDYLEVVIKENSRGIDLIYAQRMNRMINQLIDLKPTGTIEEIHAKIKVATEWNDEWVKWAIKFLKLRGHL